ncbi:hypothetical protein ACMD2_24070 [Ananas comosus]|uniref:Uncharacterized protein n=1 Tax=Ananas comosus TaxID=4615 RepID=A0A199V6T1_ANACO|nr:hypothetical protein ACMD2_24070 [Ananas comosus]
MYAMGDVSATETAIFMGRGKVIFRKREGGSLTVQILGSAQVKSNKEEDSRSNTLKSSQKQNYFSFSAVVVDSRKDVARQFKRQDKLS